jgi:hypothetical protein
MTGPSTLVARASHTLTDLRSSGRPLAPAPDGPSPAFPWLVTATGAWILAGLFVDGWFHIHDPGLETFFTPWHALLYSGVAAALLVHLVERVRRRGLPRGYLLSVVAGVVVSAAGFVDMVWHTVLGVEEDLAALLSPPHLLLITAGTLVFAGPLRAALLDASAPRLPAAFGAAYVVTGLGFFTQYANPLTHLYPVSRYSPVDGLAPGGATTELLELRAVAGVGGVIVFAVLLAGAVVAVRSLGSLPRGALFVVVAVPSAAMTTLRGTLLLLPAVLLAALAVELLGRRLPTAALAAAAPALVTLGWALTLAATRELDWGLELLTGAVCSAAAAGYLVGWVHAQGARSRA